MNFNYFKLSDFDCHETSENKMKVEFIHRLDELRERCGWAFIVTSGYRSPNHSAERNKPNGGGTHTKGIAADIRVLHGKQRHEIVKNAMAMGFTGIGVAKKFVHLDGRQDTPVMWSYR